MMGAKRDGMPLTEPVRVSAADGRDCPSRPCWVADPADRFGHQWPSLLVEGRCAAADRVGRVCVTHVEVILSFIPANSGLVA